MLILIRARWGLLLLCTVAGLAGGCGPKPSGEEVPVPDTAVAAPADTAPPPATDPAAAVPGITLPVLLDRVSERGPDGELRVLDAMNPPLDVDREPVQNRHDPTQTDTLRTLHYGGLRVEVYEVAATGKEIIRAIEVTSDAYRTEAGLTVGSTRAAVREALGAPARTEGDTFVYERYDDARDPTPTTLRIRFDGDRVAAMTWHYYVD